MAKNISYIKNKNYRICARAPLRIGLAGGGTDIYDYFQKYSGATLNITINNMSTNIINIIRKENKRLFLKRRLSNGRNRKET